MINSNDDDDYEGEAATNNYASYRFSQSIAMADQSYGKYQQQVLILSIHDLMTRVMIACLG
jgi:hypothetical protein